MTSDVDQRKINVACEERALCQALPQVPPVYLHFPTWFQHPDSPACENAYK